MLSVYYIGLVQAFFAALLFVRKPKMTIADKVLVCWLIVIGVDMVYSLLNLTIWRELPDMIILPLTYGPFMWFYMNNLFTKNPPTFRSLFPHFLSFIIFVIIAIIASFKTTVEAEFFLQKRHFTVLIVANYLTFLLSMLFYWIIVFRKISLYQKTMSERLSFEQPELKLNWLKIVAWWILGGFILSGIVYLVFLELNIYPFNPIEIYHLGLILFIFSITYFGIHQPELPVEVKNNWHTKKGEEDFVNEDWGLYLEKLNLFMLEKKPFLERELSLNQLSELMGESPQKISFCINHILNKNFFSFINEYRVKEAMNLIANPKNKNLTLLAIAFDSGFNSKSSFNSLFKKISGYTPSDYQRKHL